MRDFFNKNEENSHVNEAIFDNILGKKQPKEVKLFIKDDKGGAFINGNHINNLSNKFKYNLEDNNIWLLPELKWLAEGKYIGEDVIIDEDYSVVFSGKWIAGTCKATSFYRVGSEFLGGTFEGKKFNISNISYKTYPQNFITGTYIDNKSGILGKLNAPEKIYSEGESIEIIQIAPGSSIIIKDINKKTSGFKVIKRIDETGTDFELELIPSLKRVKLSWETIRSNYEQNAVIKIGAPYVLPGVIEIENILSFEVTKNPVFVPQAIEKINFAADTRLGMNVAMAFNAGTKERQGTLLKFKNDVETGKLYDILVSIKKEIKVGRITGYGDFVHLHDIFHDTKGQVDTSPEIRSLMKYLEDFKLNVIDNVIPYGPNSKIIIQKIEKLISVDSLQDIFTGKIPPAPTPIRKQRTSKKYGPGGEWEQQFGSTLAENKIRNEIKNILQTLPSTLGV